MTHPDATGKVHQFAVSKGQAKPEDKESVLEIVRGLLEQAEAGRVAGVAVAIVRPDGAANYTHSSSNQGIALCGATSLLLRRVMENIEQTDVENWLDNPL